MPFRWFLVTSKGKVLHVIQWSGEGERKKLWQRRTRNLCNLMMAWLCIRWFIRTIYNDTLNFSGICCLNYIWFAHHRAELLSVLESATSLSPGNITESDTWLSCMLTLIEEKRRRRTLGLFAPQANQQPAILWLLTLTLYLCFPHTNTHTVINFHSWTYYISNRKMS